MADLDGKELEKRFKALKTDGNSAWGSGYNTAIKDAIKAMWLYLGKERDKK